MLDRKKLLADPAGRGGPALAPAEALGTWRITHTGRVDRVWVRSSGNRAGSGGWTSAEIRLLLRLQAVVDAEPDGSVDVQLVEPIGRDPLNVFGLAAGGELAADRTGA